MDERDFRVLDLVDHPVFVLAPDASGVPRYAAYNTYACRKLGRKVEEFIGRTVKECFPGEFGDVAFEHHQAAMQSGEERAYEVLLPSKKGARLIRTVLKPVLDDKGQVTHLVGSSSLISSRQVVKPVEHQVSKDADAEAFIGLAAHELRSPLRNIGTIVEMLREEMPTPNEDAELLFDHFERLHGALFGHIDDILAHSNALEAREDDIEFRLEDLLDEIMLVHDPLGLCKISAAPTRIRGDRSGVHIVLGSLIDNAIKHAQPMGGALALEVAVRPDSRGLVAVTLSDNGRGFSDPALMLLDGGALRHDSGFGLFGARRLIHSRGGRLLVTRAADRSGASVTFSLRGEILADELPDCGQKAVRGR